MISRPRNLLPNTLITAFLLIIVVSVYGCKNQPQKSRYLQAISVQRRPEPGLVLNIGQTHYRTGKLIMERWNV